ncbi:MAG: hypothetical protein K8H86_14205 [Ignavibacteriaceae bacterium]|nr:hypothetical protein [Ignavibacteriaceae bacterium]
MKNKTIKGLLTTAKILGGIIFAIESLLFFFYWNWPFTAAGGRKYYPFIAIAIYLVGFILALWKGRWGGLLMLISALMLAASPFLYLTSGEVFAKILFITIVCLPPAAAGILFILSANYKSTYNISEPLNSSSLPKDTK